MQISTVVFLFRYQLRTALSVGLGMAQIGEFAFVLLSSASQHNLIPYQLYMLLMGAHTRTTHVQIGQGSSTNMIMMQTITTLDHGAAAPTLAHALLQGFLQTVCTSTDGVASPAQASRVYLC